MLGPVYLFYLDYYDRLPVKIKMIWEYSCCDVNKCDLFVMSCLFIWTYVCISTR